jgi:hypothetical protein
MKEFSDYQKMQYDAIQGYYIELSRELKKPCSLKDVIISWLTDGHAEAFRRQYMRNHKTVAVS